MVFSPVGRTDEDFRKWGSGPELTPKLCKTESNETTSTFAMSAAPPYEPLRRSSEHVPHALCRCRETTSAIARQLMWD